MVRKNGKAKNLIKKVFFSSQGFPIFITLVLISFAFIAFRMKRVEMDYALNSINKKIEKELQKNKELKAKRAKLLSIKSLKNLAKKYNLKEPSQSQVIIIP